MRIKDRLGGSINCIFAIVYATFVYIFVMIELFGNAFLVLIYPDRIEVTKEGDETKIRKK